MKKVLLTLAVAAMLAGCANDELIDLNQESITFDSFVDNATRAAIDGSYKTATLNEFQVYGTIGNTSGTANIFNGERVVRGSSLGQGVDWSYNSNNTQYWIAGNTYNFRAIAEGNVVDVTEATLDGNNMLTGVSLEDASAQKDILLAEMLDVEYTSGPKTVSFTFNHLLSKVKFTFKNTILTDNGYGYEVSNIAITNAAKDATYTIAGGWNTTSSTTYSQGFGNATTANTADAAATLIAYNGSAESNYERLVVPAEKAWTVSFTTKLYKDGVLIETQNENITTPSIKLEKGTAYNFVVSLGNPGEPIQFTVTEVKGWVTGGDKDVN